MFHRYTLFVSTIAAALTVSSGCCRPFQCNGCSPSFYQPSPGPIFPRLRPFYWANHAGVPTGAPVAVPGAPGPDCVGCGPTPVPAFAPPPMGLPPGGPYPMTPVFGAPGAPGTLPGAPTGGPVFTTPPTALPGTPPSIMKSTEPTNPMQPK